MVTCARNSTTTAVLVFVALFAASGAAWVADAEVGGFDLLCEGQGEKPTDEPEDGATLLERTAGSRLPARALTGGPDPADDSEYVAGIFRPPLAS